MSDDQNGNAMVKAAHIGIRVETAIKQAIEKAAADDRRSVASYIEKLLVEDLKAKGYLAVERPHAGRMAQGAADARTMADSAIDRALQHSTDSPGVRGDRRRALTELPAGVSKDRRRK
jgi:hypothetical protein